MGGSDFKVDASYLSPHVNISMVLEQATKTYRCPLLMSENFYMLLSLRVKERVRKVDVVQLGGKSQGLFTFQVNPAAKVPTLPDGDHSIGEVIKPETLDAPVSAIEKDGAEYLFLVDRDVVELQKGLSDAIAGYFRTALCYYVAGEWAEAKEQIEKALEIDNDGPSQAMLRFLEIHEFICPEDWAGYRPRSDVTGEHMWDANEIGGN